MIPASLFLSLGIGAAVLVTSLVSGIFGMAGGLLLMLILGTVLPVQSAMVLHGATQFVSNGWRAGLWRQWIDWGIVARYSVGAAPAILIPVAFAYVPSKAFMLILLGATPYAALAIPKQWALDAAKPAHAYACGFVVAGTQLIAGVAGPLLDTFFVRSTMDRRAVVATKATTQAISHTLKIGYYGTLLHQVEALSWDVYAAAGIAAVIGTTLAAPVLEKMSNANFRKWTQTILLVVGGISMAQGIYLWMA
jgi:uncharacterized membrane protein YfcA